MAKGEAAEKQDYSSTRYPNRGHHESRQKNLMAINGQKSPDFKQSGLEPIEGTDWLKT